MKSIRKVMAALMAVVMSVALFSTTAFAAESNKKSTDLVAIAKEAVESIDTDDLYTGNIEDPTLVYYASQPLLHGLSMFFFLGDIGNTKSPDYVGQLQDISVGVVSDLGGFYAKQYLSKTLTTLTDAANDIKDGLETAPDEIVDSVSKYVPIASDLYELSGPAGKLSIQAVLLPGYLATNVGALAFVLVGGGAALVVIIGLSGVLSPALALVEGPEFVNQLLHDMGELEHGLADLN